MSNMASKVKCLRPRHNFPQCDTSPQKDEDWDSRMSAILQTLELLD